jgi:hypothetical protein
MFKEKEYLAMPKHLQFAYTLIREAMVNDEMCTINPRIRTIIKRLKRNGVLEEATT